MILLVQGVFFGALSLLFAYEKQTEQEKGNGLPVIAQRAWLGNITEPLPGNASDSTKSGMTMRDGITGGSRKGVAFLVGEVGFEPTQTEANVVTARLF